LKRFPGDVSMLGFVFSHGTRRLAKTNDTNKRQVSNTASATGKRTIPTQTHRLRRDHNPRRHIVWKTRFSYEDEKYTNTQPLPDSSGKPGEDK